MQALWRFPTRVRYGEGVIERCGEELAAKSASVALLVVDAAAVAPGLCDEVEASLRRQRIACARFDALSAHPQELEVLQAADMFRRVAADAVIALGGGGVIDAGKLVRLAATHALPLGSHAVSPGSDTQLQTPLPPMLAIPTLAGSGTEFGDHAWLSLQATGKRARFAAPGLLPDAVLLDPCATQASPADATAAAGFQALTVCIEAYCVDALHPLADALAERGIAILLEHLPAAVADGADLVARGGLLQAALLAGVAAQKGAGACQSLALTLEATQNLPQGLAHALCLPAVLDFNRSAAADKLARIAQWLGVKADDAATLAFECSGAVRALRARLGLPETAALQPVGALAAQAWEEGLHQGNPRTCSPEDLLAICRASM